MKNYGPATQRPYQCFMGKWEGLCKTFDTDGNFIEASAVHMDVYWVDENTWHLHEHFDNLYGVGETVYHTDINVDGNRCFASNEMLSLEGTKLTAFNYVFTIHSEVTKTTVYNNHYFIDPNTRRIITHKVRDGKTHIFQIQDFVRVVQP
ncbi:MAG: hypothetical protein M9965_19910 [Anaerolineae bacterium]|nr:hypothetical protein [Anaerolineae bacterium]